MFRPSCPGASPHNDLHPAVVPTTARRSARARSRTSGAEYPRHSGRERDASEDGSDVAMNP